MRYHPRFAERRIDRLSKKFPVTVIVGARQCGKSTLLGHFLADRATFVVFDPVVDVGNARGDPELFLRLNPPPLVLDEIQFAPQLLPVLKRLVDEHRDEGGRYFLAGSQQLQVLSDVQESLAGRVLLLDLPPMSGGELAGDLEGGLVSALYSDPAPADSREPYERLRSWGPPVRPQETHL